MGCLLILILLVLVLGAGMWVTASVVGLLLTLVIAGLVGWAADLVVPGRLPGGWLGAVLAGIVGGFVGHLIFGLLHLSEPGPVIFDIHLIPAFVGAVVIAVLAELFTSRRSVA
jgi:uncharacterized membrane protein YeaQ/YmgE (transglycosylase-associated protein family)